MTNNERLKLFFRQNKAVRIKTVAKESGVSYSTLISAMKERRNMKDITFERLVPTLIKYGYNKR